MNISIYAPPNWTLMETLPNFVQLICHLSLFIRFLNKLK